MCVVQAVYDASPVVRAEVAVGLARLADSHSVLFQVRMTGLGIAYFGAQLNVGTHIQVHRLWRITSSTAHMCGYAVSLRDTVLSRLCVTHTPLGDMQDAVHDKMLNTSRVLKHNTARPAALQPAGASPPGATRSAPQETYEPRGRQMERLSSSHGASPTQAEQEKDTDAGLSLSPMAMATYSPATAILSPACITSLEPSLSSRASCSVKANNMVAGHGCQQIWRVAAWRGQCCPHCHVCAR